MTDAYAATGVDQLIERVRRLDDDERAALAQARAGVDEAFHVGARRAAHAALMDRGTRYFDAWLRMGHACVPDRLEELIDQGADADPDEVRRWQEVARLVHAAVDDALLARCADDTLRPPDLRELLRAWTQLPA